MVVDGAGEATQNSPGCDPLMSTVPNAVQVKDAQERRLSVERRLGERRLRLVTVPQERRATRERRRPFDRRETASGHLRNALQILTDLAEGRITEVEAADGLRAVIGRLHQCLREVERLATARSHLGRRLRGYEAARRVR